MRFLLILTCVLFVQSSFANWKKTPSKFFSIEPPPASGSVEHRDELQELLALQSSRTMAQCNLAYSMFFPTVGKLFRSRKDLLNSRELYVTRKFLTNVMRYTMRVSSYYKGKFMRARPYSVEPKIKPCIPKIPGSRSYPSSHASSSFAVSCVLSKLMPSKANQLFEFGKYLGDLRAIVGVHHMSDVRAGQKLGLAICNELMRQEDFLQELSAVKAAL